MAIDLNAYAEQYADQKATDAVAAKVAELQPQIDQLKTKFDEAVDEINADAQSITDLNTEVNTLQAQLAAGPTLPLWGMAYNDGTKGNQIPLAIEQQVGHVINIHRVYFEANQVTQGLALVEANAQAGRGSWVSYKAPYSWTDMAAGKGDTWYLDILNRLGAIAAKYGVGIGLTIHHEPEGDELDWPAYFTMYQHLALTPRPAGVKLGPIFITYNEFAGAQKGSFAQYIGPTWRHGDFVGFDVYCANGTAANPTAKFWEVGTQYFEMIADLAKGWGVDWAIGEIGVSGDAMRNNPSALGWIERAYHSAAALGGCWAICYWNDLALTNSTTNVTDGKPAWTLDGVGGRLASWIKIAKTLAPA